MKYLLDSNIYINFYDRYYRKEFFPSFWQKLPKLLNENVIIPKIVVSENYQNEAFKAWLSENYNKDLLDHRDYAQEWGEVLEHIQTCGFYKQEALIADKGWAHEKIADPWLIAISKEEGYTVVTSEQPVTNLNQGRPSRNAKIPDVCHQLNVNCIDMNQFFREINLSV
ncbi:MULTISPECIES: DUF4411 family protein [Streptococcus]|uniref:DUF4411 family protein n=2 Tax=Streptococcus TaxID=1301 RepID=A0A380JF81_STRDO|nr:MULTISPECIES: DUF4411 family protein [Streptococcus]AWN18760.1 DUF4411 domain-containing protein [Streptococcus sobrinus]EFQ57526.1 hypothetical protein HMPREF9176_1742 [Streptococcus downei F0415]RKW09377.1 MAG: DUF4411 family protein [Catonella sp.]SUN36585.1 Uncharacterised protein [Streptococcus downei MFe28]